MVILGESPGEWHAHHSPVSLVAYAEAHQRGPHDVDGDLTSPGSPRPVHIIHLVHLLPLVHAMGRSGEPLERQIGSCHLEPLDRLDGCIHLVT